MFDLSIREEFLSNNEMLQLSVGREGVEKLIDLQLINENRLINFIKRFQFPEKLRFTERLAEKETDWINGKVRTKGRLRVTKLGSLSNKKKFERRIILRESREYRGFKSRRC